MKQLTIRTTIFFTCILFPVLNFAQTQHMTREMCRDSVLAENFDAAIKGYSRLIQTEKENRTRKRGVEADLVAEYAYALALDSITDRALATIDLARSMEAGHADFYTAQIFELLGFHELAGTFMNGAEIPKWIESSYQDIAIRHRVHLISSDNDMKSAFIKANVLTKQKQYVQAIIKFEEITDNYPTSYMPYIGYSTTLENLGMYGEAADKLQHGLNLIGQRDSSTTAVLQKHLDGLKITIARKTSPNFFERISDKYEPSFMLYAGGSAGKNNLSLNGRLGFFTKNKFSGTLNLGYSYISKDNAFNIGIAAYQMINIFVVGLGINEQISKNSTFSISPSVGISLMNQKGNASYDIMCNLFIPCKRGHLLSYTISFGRTYYFNFNPKKK